MIKALTAVTEEIDDVEAAVAELLQQLDMEHNLRRYSVGLVHCYNDFWDSGVIKALWEQLPFDVVGCTTLSVSVPGFMSQMGLALTVLTSDDVQFSAGVSEPVSDDVVAPVTALYQRLTADLPQQPVMLMPFIPFMLSVGGDEFLAQIDVLSGGLPAFGTLSISNDPGLVRAYTFYNGEGYAASLVLLVLSGEVNPTFLSVSVTDDNILKQKAVVTGTNRNLLQTVNNLPAARYLESLGLMTSGGGIGGMESMPFIAYLEDGSRLVRACAGATEDGSVILCGAVPVNATLALATMGPEDVITSTRDTIQSVLAEVKGRCALMYSCAARHWALGMRQMAEHEVVRACIGEQISYYFVYSGGEIFPARLSDDRTVNHLQNDSVIICLL
jgi:hypothetical protein